MQPIDCVYLINLEKRPEKLEKSLRDLSRFSIRPQLVQGVYGWALSREEIASTALKFGPNMNPGHNTTCRPVRYLTEKRIQLPTTYGEPCYYPMTTPGAFGCALSHLTALNHAYDSGFPIIWVLEDDFNIIKDPHALGELIQTLAELDPEWDVLFTDDCDWFEIPFLSGSVWRPDSPSIDGKPFLRKEMGGQFVQISGRSQMRSTILTRSGIQKILEFAGRGLFLPYPLEILFVPNLKIYNTLTEIVTGAPVSLETSDVLFQYF